MANEAGRVEAYLDTIGRLEPDIAMIDHDAGIASIAISLKRIADALDVLVQPPLMRMGEDGIPEVMPGSGGILRR